MSSVIAPGKDFTLAFLHWPDILFSSITDTMEPPAMSVVFLLHLWWVWFSKLMFLGPLSDCTRCCLEALNTVWYCWRISYSQWSKLAFLICSCPCCCSSNDKLLLLHWLLTSSLTVSQFWKYFVLWKCLKVLLLIFFYDIKLIFILSNWKSIRTDRFIIHVASFFRIVLICKLLQEKLVSSRFLVTSFNKFIKLSTIFCLLPNSFLKKIISSYRNLSKQ